MSDFFSLHKAKQFLLFVGIVLLSMSIVTIYFGMALKVPPFLIIKSFAKQGYTLHHNYIKPPIAFGLFLHIYIFFIFYYSLLLALAFRDIMTERLGLDARQSMMSIGIVLFALISANHLYNFLYYYNFEKKLYGGRSLMEKNANLYDGIAYKYAFFCHQYISGPQNAQLVTDADLNRDPGMLAHRMLAYYLYPIDIRNVRQKEPDYLLFFMKRNARQYVPDNFEIVAEMNKNYLIAKRK